MGCGSASPYRLRSSARGYSLQLSCQKGGSPVCRLSVPCFRRLRQISAANLERLSGGVARIISTAAATGITVDSPFMLVTAVSHWPNDFAPCVVGLNCRVNLPSPAARSVFPQRTLQERHCHMRFAGAESSSWPLICRCRFVRSGFRRMHTVSGPAADSLIV